MELKNGFYDVPPGKLAAVVTHLEMRARVPLRPAGAPEGVTLTRVQAPAADWYRALFRAVGAEDWLWFSRLVMAEEALAAILRDPRVEVYALRAGGADKGLLELDFRQEGECELAFFGLASELIGGGVGRWLMNRAIEMAWRPGIARFHVHTCTLDSPQALPFYIRSGFVPWRRQVEIADDPRLTGLLPETAAPQVPILR
ncbi:GNAT family N-acetyltransferase [Actibacterium sp. MT2.3-13A]|uniref:GNAT family N-acetyltransferase n=1 Tax=Actibacterium sp. MT2.3-13A TaxID=2828332 RepID=UPI001BAABE3E|nr:GNAT family N-acetyltransferase [Actibacterium sp. MT2.3-13A]